MRIVSLILFLISIWYFTYQVYWSINTNISEYNNINWRLSNTTDSWSWQISQVIYNSNWILLLKDEKDVQQNITKVVSTTQVKSYGQSNTTTKIEKSLEDKIKELSITYTNSEIYIPWYIEKNESAPIIWATNEDTIYEDLLHWVRWASTWSKPWEKWLVFLEAHSWQNYRNNLTYSFFDNLSMYYNQIDHNLPIYIKTDTTLFEYRLYKKEIVEPGKSELTLKDPYALVLMTCYPRNTSQKRALLYAKLVNVTDLTKTK